jgi:hypothetical protein
LPAAAQATRLPRGELAAAGDQPVDANTIEYEATITDPIVYSRPFTIAKPLKRLNGELMEAACHEEEHDLPGLKRIRDMERAKNANAPAGGR